MNEDSKYCPQCQSPYCYFQEPLWICPECFYQWSIDSQLGNKELVIQNFLDGNGVQLQNGDTVVVLKDLKVGSTTLKSGTKVKNIRLLDNPVNGHDISCKIDGMGALYLKCSVVKKV